MKTNPVLFPRLKRIMVQVGEQIQLARLRRDLSMEQISERAGISRSTLTKIEKGVATVSIASYLQVLFILGLEKDFLLLAQDDTLGRKIQDLNLKVNKRASKKPKVNEKQG